MDTSILIAKILGPLYVVSAFAWLFNQKTYGKMIADFSTQRGLLYITAILAFLFGAVILSFHNVWSSDWRIIITVLGYLGLLKGLTLLVFPEFSMQLTHKVATMASLMNGLLLLVFAVGIVLVWFGYSA